MLIINPLYDNAFKYLMDNQQIAKIVLSILIGEKVITLQAKPQETPVLKDGVQYTSRFDFKAVVQLPDLKQKTILIELQKYKNPNPVARFRRYLAENYSREETVIDENGKEITVSLPIYAIYILGYKVTKEEEVVVIIDNFGRSGVTNSEKKIQCEFIDLMTHKCIIIQTTAKPEKFLNTRLERFIKLFNQKLENTPSNFLIEVENETDDEIKKIQEHLHQATMKEDLIRRLTLEKELENSYKTLEENFEKEREAKELAEKNAVEALQREKEAQQREKEAQQREKEALQKIERTIIKLYKKGFSLSEIAEDLEISEAEVQEVLEKQ